MEAESPAADESETVESLTIDETESESESPAQEVAVPDEETKKQD